MTSTIIIVALLGLIFGLILAFASKIFHVDTDERIEQINSVLPQANCGACGYPGCAAFANAVVQGEAPVSGCLPGGDSVSHQIADLIGEEALETEPMMAVVHCAGGTKEAKQRAIYDGIDDCWAAELSGGGDKECEAGCLGLSSCVRACAFDALHINENGIAIVDPEKCTGCTECVPACPRNLIEMIPQSQKIFLACNTPDRGAKVKKYCSVGCTGCTLCVKVSPTPNSIAMQGNLPRLTIGTIESFVASKYKCPSNSFTDLVPSRPVANIATSCTGCGDCVPVCPVKNTITGEPGERFVINKQTCIGCGICVPVCPEKSISMWGALGYEDKHRRSSTSRHFF